MEQKFERNIADLNTEVVRVRDEFRNSFNNDHLLQRELMSFKGDLESIKGLLLNRLVWIVIICISNKKKSHDIPSFTIVRKQFASPIVHPPSIPAWQLQAHRNASVGNGADIDKNDDAGSGGSSETEVVTKNSDSSLELM